uniref:Uncharacterized protein n=1 Tax=Rousettus aegyptiacus TaxID=9407 RepID=A0A7J8FI82_ROUAE|nr:hypothetical protein HJG63_011879 [Rousettus aegyptiacus]
MVSPVIGSSRPACVSVTTQESTPMGYEVRSGRDITICSSRFGGTHACELRRRHAACHSILQSGFPCQKAPRSVCSPPSLPVHVPPSPPGDHGSFPRLHRFAFSGMSYSWNHAVCRLADVTIEALRLYRS